METTKLYIELIVIGFETFSWMNIFLIDIVGNKILSFFTKTIDNFSSSILLVVFLYIIGLLFDRLADMIFKKTEKKIRMKSSLQAQTSILIWEKYHLEKFSDYMRSKIRILRASILNIPLITFGSIWFVVKYYIQDYMVIIYISLLGIIFSFIAWKSFNETVYLYYIKAHILEMNNRMG